MRHVGLAFWLGLASLFVGFLGPFAIFAGWRALRIARATDSGATAIGMSLLGLVMGCLGTASMLVLIGFIVLSAIK
jgi:hypothetical protein